MIVGIVGGHPRVFLATTVGETAKNKGTGQARRLGEALSRKALMKTTRRRLSKTCRTMPCATNKKMTVPK